MILELKDKLTKVLIERGLLKEGDLEKALSIQKEKGGSLSDVLVELGFVTRNDLMIALSHGFGIPPINLSRYKIDPDVIKLIPKKVAKNYKILPISKMGDRLMLAIADPLNILLLDDITTLTGLKINPVIATEKDISEAQRQYYDENAFTAIEKIVGDMKEASDIKLLEEEAELSVQNSSELLKITQDAPVVKITNLLLAEAVNLRSSDILIEPLEDQLRVRYRVDGVLREGRRSPIALHNAVISRLKVMSNLDIAERRLPQDGRFKAKLHGREVDFRISVIPSSRGEKIALRILDKSQATLDIDKLGFDTASLNEIRKAASRPHGMILMCGPTGCGKTTTLYSIMQHVNSPEKNIVTVEDPVEYLIEGVNQVTSRPEIGLTFAAALRSILRQDPNIIMIGEIRDFETVDIAIKAALTGHLVLSTLHTTTATGSVIRLINMGVEPFLITSSLILVGAQRLVRRVCPHCKEPYELAADMQARLNIKLEKGKRTFYRAKGCDLCFRTGYKGRVGLIEVLPATPKIRALILENAQEYRIREEARREGMMTLRENGIKNALDGVTTLEEVLRVTAGDQDLDTV
ncbi:MAG: ATPase, T2SS/T4P/T4SS family [Candidatus Omnitrophica bacterium]|nr:ATPase, T2SS/T4P/T4SS family [Candidatus Omnitrophota bacterium]MDD5437229.1 ATPase, T2SS/T4P/T4SS family [Candidatus Omnitrophota bacterium]